MARRVARGWRIIWNLLRQRRHNSVQPELAVQQDDYLKCWVVRIRDVFVVSVVGWRRGGEVAFGNRLLISTSALATLSKGMPSWISTGHKINQTNRKSNTILHRLHTAYDMFNRTLESNDSCRQTGGRRRGQRGRGWTTSSQRTEKCY